MPEDDNERDPLTRASERLQGLNTFTVGCPEAGKVLIKLLDRAVDAIGPDVPRPIFIGEAWDKRDLLVRRVAPSWHDSHWQGTQSGIHSWQKSHYFKYKHYMVDDLKYYKYHISGNSCKEQKYAIDSFDFQFLQEVMFDLQIGDLSESPSWHDLAKKRSQNVRVQK